MTERVPVAYIRRSAADAGSPGDISRDVQEAAIRELAHRDGYNGDVTYFVDWAKSASEEKSAMRTAYAEMLKRIESGQVSHVYAYALDRLNRSLIMTARFAKACDANDVRIITHKEGEVRQDTPAEWLRWTTVATFGEYELRMTKARAASARERRIARGDRFGHAPYGHKHVRGDGGRITRVPNPDEPLQPILDAYRDAGSVLGACRLLEARGVRAPKGGERWATSALTRIIEREAPETLPRRTLTGRRTPSSAMLAHLVRCPFCDRMLTPNGIKAQYYCANGAQYRTTHPRYVVREVDLMPFVQEEAARYRAPIDAIESEGIEARQAAIEERLDRARELYMSGRPENRDRDRARFDAEKASADRDLEDLQGRATVAALHPEVDWTVAPDIINGVLRSLWREVRLDASMRPIGIEWIFPELRA